MTLELFDNALPHEYFSIFLMGHGRMFAINKRRESWKEAVISCFRWV